MKIVQNIVTLILVAFMVMIAASCRLTLLPSRDKNDALDKTNNPSQVDTTLIKHPEIEFKKVE